MYIRPVTRDDLDAVLMIARAAGIGMTSLPADTEVLHEKIERAAKTFDMSLKNPEDALYFFVMEDEETQQIVGTCGIEAFVGLRRPMFSYKIITVTRHSETLNKLVRNEMLHMVNDYTGVSEIGSLFLLPEYRRDRLGRFLSRMRLQFMAIFRERFGEKVIAEIRGWHDGKGNSPFYDSLAKNFFHIDFTEADWICATQGNRFISELMPTYPIYVDLLPIEAQNVIGVPYVNSEPAKAMLEREGFKFNKYVDVFDGGPTLEADIDNLRIVRDITRAPIRSIVAQKDDMQRKMLMTTDFARLRAVLGWIEEHDDGTISLDRHSAELLHLHLGDVVAISGA
ncbi:MAG: arginine N-succinyltransferase [Alphaproteobacteria bacterium]|nr:MAG: arginine N-succinyltransferase [Alphaproteobacteria bacterium]